MVNELNGIFKCEMFLKPGELINGGPQVVEGPSLLSWMGIVYPDGSMDVATTGTPEDWLPDVSPKDKEWHLKQQLYVELVKYFGRKHLKPFGVDREALRESVISG